MYEVHWVVPRKKIDNHHGTFATYGEAADSIRAWWKKHKFEPPYVRVWAVDGVTTWDYGSHVCFYKIKEVI